MAWEREQAFQTEQDRMQRQREETRLERQPDPPVAVVIPPRATAV